MSGEVWVLESADVDPVGESIFRGAPNPWTQDVEEALHLHPAIRDCIVMEMPHLTYGKDVFAFVTLRAELTGREQELRDWVQGKIRSPKTLERIVILQQLPKGATGKVDRSALKDLVVSLETGIEVVT
jgi:acyl-coenzyme A synthetase/AMP-(fatty) acid ligase